jgi:hypothetical protein
MFEDAPIHQWLHGAEGEQQFRAALEEKYPFLVHNTPLCRLSKIREGALICKHPGVVTTPATILNRFGGRPPVLCLAPPLVDDPWRNLQQHSGDFVKLGIAAKDLPGCLGLDWSFPPRWNLAAVLGRDSQGADAVQVALEVVRRGAVVVTYDDVGPDLLRIWVKGSAIDRPSDWPTLAIADPNSYETWHVQNI